MKLALILLVLGSLARAAIIGADDRHEWFEEKSPVLKELGLSTAVMVTPGTLVSDRTGIRFTDSVLSHAEFDRLCTGVRFREQPAPGSCTGFLVGKDLLMTAAHCLQQSCSDTQFLFDFLLREKGNAPARFKAASFHTCREVVRIDKEEDWAILRLDRATVGRTPFRPRPKSEPALGTPVVMLGFPRGIPLKIADGAKVTANQNANEETHFEADLDSFGGNSGSPIINARGELEGILLVAFGEFEDDEIDPVTGKDCRRLRHWPDPRDATHAWALRASRFARHLINAER